MWDSMRSSFVSFSPTNLSAVLLKNSFLVDKSAQNLFMFVLRIRCMTWWWSFSGKRFPFPWHLHFLLFRFCSLCRLSSFHVFGFYWRYIVSDLFLVANCQFWYLSSRELVVSWISSLNSGSSFSLTIKINLFRVSNWSSVSQVNKQLWMLTSWNI